jgi:RimK family alpha-L-glutamate ligase
MEQFKSFITEAKEEKYRILVVSEKPDNNDLFHTTQRFVDECKKVDIPCYVLFASKAKIVDGKAFNADDKEGFEISRDDTIAIIRGSTASRDAGLDLVSQLEKLGICCINSRSTISMCADKYWTSLRLADASIPTPKTALVQSEDTLQASLDIIGEEYPLILKTLRGSKGVGVIFIESKRQLSSLLQLLWKQDETTEILLQSYIKSDFDVRVLVLGGKIQAAMRREVIKGDFRSNVSQGAKVKKYKLSDEEITICLSADKAVNGVWTAVDFIKNGKDTFVLEVNSSPGTEGIEEATGQNIIKEILQHFKNKNTWRYSALEVGWEEIVTVTPCGKLIAKFDTGNSIKSVIHAEDVKVNGKKITFTLNGKTITTKLVGNYTSVTGAGEDDRYIVELEFEFAGTNYGKVQFGLDDRSRMGTDVLLNRDLMNRLNVMVNPQRKYVVTTPYTLDK